MNDKVKGAVQDEFGDRDIITVGSIKVRLLFFDSLGAKCSSVLVNTPDVSILIDPGAAGLQPGFPLSSEEKALLREKAYERILRYGASSDVVVISHYHYDHHVHPSRLEEMAGLFKRKTLLVKDPNHWINKSQRKRSLDFLSSLYRIFGEEESFEKVLSQSRFVMKKDLTEEYPKTSAIWQRAKGKKMMVYQAKLRWFEKIVESWRKNKWIEDFKVGDTKVMLADGKSFTFGDTKICFSQPMFHGQFLDNIGWVLGVLVKFDDDKFLFTSDLQGPIIEEYADWIIRSEPDFIVADGPPLYTYGFMIGKEDVEQVIKNMQNIMREARPRGILWDHHMCRGLFRSKLKRVYSYAKKLNVKICTAAEYIGRKPLIEEVASIS
ncbi:hypothetical protein CW705_01815 [Candidatus Bathyarchaeota archaeon]|nr:MAG: hypothetical protein CW705_01815 [Candidatus Bathyarchaeota archaeon]